MRQQEHRRRGEAADAFAGHLPIVPFSRRALLAGSAAALLGAPPERATAIRDVAVIDAVDGLRRNQTVIVRGDKISAAGPVKSTPIPAGAALINGSGKYLIPGLWDMHVHLWYKENQLLVCVAHGVTGVRDMGSDLDRVNAWRSGIENGKAIGPRIVTAGPAVDGRKSDDEKLPVLVAISPEDARRVFDHLYRLDIDFIKILSGLPREAFFALAEQARHWQIQFAGHLPDEVSIPDAVRARVASLEHLFGFVLAGSTDEAHLRGRLVKALAARDGQAYRVIENLILDTYSEKKLADFAPQLALYKIRITPTLSMRARMALENPDAYAGDPRYSLVPDSIRNTWPDPRADYQKVPADALVRVRRENELCRAMVPRLRRAGVEILAGTDTGDPYTIPGATLHDELEALVEAGLTPLQAIESATLAPARFFAWEDSMGAVQPGLAADLVLLRANPLEQIRNSRQVEGVFCRGRWFDRQKLAYMSTVQEKPGNAAPMAR